MTGANIRAFQDDITRSIRAVSLGMVRDVDARDARKRELGMRETFQLFQVPIAGEAGANAVWTSVAVQFDYHFYYSPGTNDSALEVPNFAFGMAALSAQVFAAAHVASWTRDPDNDAVTGATVNIGAALPGATELVSYSGSAHLTFCGWASLYEDETDMSQ